MRLATVGLIGAAILLATVASPIAAGSVRLVKDIHPRIEGGNRGSHPRQLVNVGGTLFFIADDGAHGYELWKSDGTRAGTKMVKDIAPGGASGLMKSRNPLVAVNGSLYFVAYDGVHGRELWKSDGTNAGTKMVKDIYPGPWREDIGISSWPQALTRVGATLFFSANDGVHGRELWKSDGTKAGTQLVKDVWAGERGSMGFGHELLAAAGGRLFFEARDGFTHGEELWKSDGTSGGTKMLTDVEGSLQPRDMVGVDGSLYFRGTMPGVGDELWKSDGTKAGTKMVKDINRGATGSSPYFFVGVGGAVFFGARGRGGQELWKSDGTAAGTKRVKNIFKEGGGQPEELTDLGRTLVFRARNARANIELWRSRGTAKTTRMIRDIRPGGLGSRPQSLIRYGRGIFFAADDGKRGLELWRWKGPGKRPRRSADVRRGPGSSAPGDLTKVGDKVFFAADDGRRGRELWVWEP